MWIITFPIILGTMALVTGSTDIAEVCPYTKFKCTEGSHLQYDYNTLRSCCAHCSCNDKCDFVGNCCHDIGRKVLPTVYKCRTQRKIYSSYLRRPVKSTSKLNFKYRVVSECDTVLLDTRMENLAESIHRCEIEAHILEDLAFVTSTTSGVTYLNKHCALCNGEHDFITWDLYTFSSNIDQLFAFSSFTSRNDYLLAKVLVASIPTSNLAMTALCSDREYNKCNMTGRWDFYDQKLQEKCEKYTARYPLKIPTGYELFKNPFCCLCNREKSFEIQIDCENIFLDSGRSTLTFSALIKPSKNTPKDTTPKPCKGGEILDPFHNECTQMYCPPGSAMTDETCEFYFDDIVGLVMAVPYFVMLSEGSRLFPLNHKKLLRNLRQFFIRMINSSDCAVCKAELEVTDNDTIIFTFHIESSRGCSYGHYMTQIATFPETMQIYSESNYVNATLTSIKSYDQIVGNPQVHISQPTFSCKTDIHYNETIVLCPSLITNTAVIENLDIDLSIKTNIVRQSVALDKNGSIRVCLDHYNQMYALVSSAAYNAMRTHLTVLLYIIIVIVTM